VVDEMWIQSWVVGETIQTRTVMRLVPLATEISLQLEAGAAAKLQTVRMNGRSVPVSLSDETVVIDTTELQTLGPSVVEVVEQGPLKLDGAGNLQVIPPRVVGAGGYRRVFWQLILPQSLHGFCLSKEFVSESPWTFKGAYWARVPSLSQADLEDFLGVPHTPTPSGSTNQLLVIGLDLPPVLKATLIRRSSLVLLTSGGILAIGILVIYLPALQRLEFAALVVIVLAIAGILYAEWAPFIAQAGIMGLALILVAAFFKQLVPRWQSATTRVSADTSIFRRETPAAGAVSLPPASVEGASSGRTLVHSLSDPGVQHSTS
jgi:hypothetical protein